MVAFEENAVYAIKNAPYLSSQQEDMLSSCYLPMLGSASFALYHLFLALGHKENSSFFTSGELMKASGLSLMEIRQSAGKLEGTGLLATFRLEKADKVNYQLVLYLPLPGPDFFKNPLFIGYLSKTFEERDLFALKSRFGSANQPEAEYYDVSAKFNDVFDMDDVPDFYNKLSGEELTEAVKQYKPVEVTFSESAFQSEMEKMTESFEASPTDIKEISRLSSLYGLSEKEASQIIAQSCLDSEGVLSLTMFERLCPDYHKYGVNREEYQSDDVSFGVGDVKRRLDYYNKTSPLLFLGQVLNAEPTASYKKLLNTLSDTYKVSNPIINVIVDYTIQKCQGSLPEEYACKIAISLMKNKIASASEAMAFLYQSNQSALERKHKKDRQETQAQKIQAKEEMEKEVDNKNVKEFNVDDIIEGDE